MSDALFLLYEKDENEHSALIFEVCDTLWH